MSTVGTSIGLFAPPINLLNNLNVGPSNKSLYRQCLKNNKKSICDERYINIPQNTIRSGPGLSPFFNFSVATTGRVVVPNN